MFNSTDSGRYKAAFQQDRKGDIMKRQPLPSGSLISKMHMLPSFSLLSPYTQRPLKSRTRYLDLAVWHPQSEHHSQSTGTHSGVSESRFPQHSQRHNAHFPSQGHEGLGEKNKGES